MKIEKVSDNQIRCTLTKADLADRHLKISELAYGSEKAKCLFRDMMQQAANEFGFEADDIPLMIEAIPLSSECIILVITKVEDPDELDTRFSRFSPSEPEDEYADECIADEEGADEVLDYYNNIQKVKQKNSVFPETASDPVSNPEVVDLTRFYLFTDLDSVITVSKVLLHIYEGQNSLYKNPSNGSYSLIISKSRHSPEEFNKICNILSEYGTQEKASSYSQAYLNEHFENIVLNNALQTLSQI